MFATMAKWTGQLSTFTLVIEISANLGRQIGLAAFVSLD